MLATKMNRSHSFIITTVIGIVFAGSLNAEIQLNNVSDQKPCPTDCQCVKEEVRCIGIRNDIISAMPKGIKTM